MAMRYVKAIFKNNVAVPTQKVLQKNETEVMIIFLDKTGIKRSLVKGNRISPFSGDNFGLTPDADYASDMKEILSDVATSYEKVNNLLG